MSVRAIGAVAFWTAAAFAHDPITTKLTWSQEISRIFLKRCMTCHQPGGPAPFFLTSYEEARPWAVAIRDEVSNRTMPPWGAVKGFGDFREDLSLSQEEISLIIDWVNGGAPEGEKHFTPSEAAKLYAPVSTAGRVVRVTNSVTLTKATRIVGIRPRSLTNKTEAQIVAQLPDGTVEPLLWVKNWNTKFAYDFVLRKPLDLPASARVLVFASGGEEVSFDLVIAPQPRQALAPAKSASP